MRKSLQSMVLLMGALVLMGTGCAKQNAPAVRSPISAVVRGGQVTYVWEATDRRVVVVYPPAAFVKALVSPEAYLLYRAHCVPRAYPAWKDRLSSGQVRVSWSVSMGWGRLDVSWKHGKGVPPEVLRFLFMPDCSGVTRHVLEEEWSSRTVDVPLEVLKRMFLSPDMPKGWGDFPKTRELRAAVPLVENMVFGYIVPQGTNPLFSSFIKQRHAPKRDVSVLPWTLTAPSRTGDLDISMDLEAPRVLCASRMDGISSDIRVCDSLIDAVGPLGRAQECRVVEGPPDLVVLSVTLMDGQEPLKVRARLRRVLSSLSVKVQGLHGDMVWRFMHGVSPWMVHLQPVPGPIRCLVVRRSSL